MIMTQLKRLMMAAFGFAALATAFLLPAQAPVAGAAMLDGEATFRAKCAICHGADGSGNTPTGKKMGLRALGLPSAKLSMPSCPTSFKRQRQMPAFSRV